MLINSINLIKHQASNTSVLMTLRCLRCLHSIDSRPFADRRIKSPLRTGNTIIKCSRSYRLRDSRLLQTSNDVKVGNWRDHHRLDRFLLEHSFKPQRFLTPCRQNPLGINESECRSTYPQFHRRHTLRNNLRALSPQLAADAPADAGMSLPLLPFRLKLCSCCR